MEKYLVRYVTNDATVSKKTIEAVSETAAIEKVARKKNVMLVLSANKVVKAEAGAITVIIIFESSPSYIHFN